MRSLSCFATALAIACGGALPRDEATQDLQAPRATVVLLRGMGNVSEVAGLGYFWRVPELYRSLGANVVVPDVSGYASVETRAAELKRQLDAVPGPLILIGHSQGGLDARYLVSRLGYGGRVRAVVTIGTPHHGSLVADVALGLAPGPLQAAIDCLVGRLGWSLDGVREMTVYSMEHRFNPAVPDVPGVAYWSFAGRAAPFGLGRGNGWLHTPLLATWALLDAEVGASDGVVPEESARWGTFLGSVPADHLGEVGQPGGFTPGFDESAFYTRLLHSLRDQGW